MRLIDADALIDTIGAMIGYGTTPTEIWDMVDSAPSIDIVRCRECKYWHKKDDLTYCDRIDYSYGYKADDFCSRGERKDK